MRHTRLSLFPGFPRRAWNEWTVASCHNETCPRLARSSGDRLNQWVMNVHDYLIDENGKDWPELLSGWLGALPPSFTVWLVNRFGDAFAVFEDDSVHMLDVGIGAIKRVADSRDHFAAQIDVDDNANKWLMIHLVDRCVAAGLNLGHNQCYGYKVPPILGGDYTVENVEPTDLSVHYSLLADIYHQTKNLADGTRIKTVVIK
jgi:hypothetical protein